LSDNRDDRKPKEDDKPRGRDGGGIGDLVDRAIEWLGGVLAPAPAPVPVPVRVRRPVSRRR
jgi:hypothetical protein